MRLSEAAKRGRDMSRSATLFSQEGVSGGYGSEADRPVTITHFLTCRWIQAWKNKMLKDFPRAFAPTGRRLTDRYFLYQVDVSIGVFI